MAVLLGTLLAGIAHFISAGSASRQAEVDRSLKLGQLKRMNEAAIRRVGQIAAAGYLEPTGTSATLKTKQFVPPQVKSLFNAGTRTFTFTDCLPSKIDDAAEQALFAAVPADPATTCTKETTKVRLVPDSFVDPYVTVEATTTSGTGNREIKATMSADVPIFFEARILVYNLQPAGSSASYETYMKTLTNYASSGYRIEFRNRRAEPSITTDLLRDYDIVWLVSGCGGATGLPTASEIEALRAHFFSGGSLVIHTDDNQGDSLAPGSCHARVNPIAQKLGVVFSGLLYYRDYGCMALSGAHPLAAGNKVNPNTPAAVSLTNSQPWGNLPPRVIANYAATGQRAQVLVERTKDHGVAFFSAAYGLFKCGDETYLERVLHYLGKKPT